MGILAQLIAIACGAALSCGGWLTVRGANLAEDTERPRVAMGGGFFLLGFALMTRGCTF